MQIVVAYLRMMNGTHQEVIYFYQKHIALIVVEKLNMSFGWTTDNGKWNYRLES